MDYTVQHETAGDRLQVIARPLTLPGCCAVCGYVGTNVDELSDVRVFIDWQLDVDFYGRVYLCSGCLLQASEVLGWLSVKQADELREKVQAQESELIVLREQNERLRASLASLLGSDDGAAISRDLVSPANEQPRDESSQGAIESSQQSELASSELISEQGSNSVPATNGSDTIGGFDL